MIRGIDINKPFTKSDLDELYEVFKNIPKTPIRVRVGIMLAVILKNNTTTYGSKQDLSKIGYIQTLTSVPIVCDKDLEPLQYEIDYD